MKTPMQEHIEWIKKVKKRLESAGELGTALHIGGCIEHAESMLEKERERLCDAYIKGGDAQYQYIIEGSFPYNTAEDWYNKTFKTKER